EGPVSFRVLGDRDREVRYEPETFDAGCVVVSDETVVDEPEELGGGGLVLDLRIDAAEAVLIEQHERASAMQVPRTRRHPDSGIPGGRDGKPSRVAADGNRRCDRAASLVDSGNGSRELIGDPDGAVGNGDAARCATGRKRRLDT